MKRCSDCGIEKPASDFPTRDRKQSRDGLGPYCRECQRIRNRVKNKRWRERHPDKMREANRRTKERLGKDYFRAWYQKNIEKERERARQVMAKARADNPARAAANQRRYRAANAEKVREREREKTYARRARQPHSAELAELMAQLVTQPCAYCGATENITIDHIIPLSRGGKHEAKNLAPACYSCNSSKCNRLLSEWVGRPKRSPS